MSLTQSTVFPCGVVIAMHLLIIILVSVTKYKNNWILPSQLGLVRMFY